MKIPSVSCSLLCAVISHGVWPRLQGITGNQTETIEEEKESDEKEEVILRNHKQEYASAVFRIHRFYTICFSGCVGITSAGFPCCRATRLFAEPLASLRGLSFVAMKRMQIKIYFNDAGFSKNCEWRFCSDLRETVTFGPSNSGIWAGRLVTSREVKKVINDCMIRVVCELISTSQQSLFITLFLIASVASQTLQITHTHARSWCEQTSLKWHSNLSLKHSLPPCRLERWQWRKEKVLIATCQSAPSV